MAKKTVFAKIVPEGTKDGIIEFPQDRVVYVAQLTDEGPTTDEERESFKAPCMKEVFKRCKPSKNIDLKTENGEPRRETFQFNSIQDFEDEQLIANSTLLHEEQGEINAYREVIQQLKENKTLQKVIKDNASREDLKNVLVALLAEIEESEN